MSLLSALVKEVETLLGFHKVNTSAYHLQTDRLVERYNRTLKSMLAKTAQDSGRDLDRRLPYVLFAYRACCQEPTQESSFFFVHGRDPKLPTPDVLDPRKTRVTMDLCKYGTELYSRMSTAWDIADSTFLARRNDRKLRMTGGADQLGVGKGREYSCTNPLRSLVRGGSL